MAVEDTTLFAGLHQLRTERLDRLDFDTVVVIDTHWFSTIEFLVAAHDRRAGCYTSDELPRGMESIPYCSSSFRFTKRQPSVVS